MDSRFFKYAFGCSTDSICSTVLITPILSVRSVVKHLTDAAVFKGKVFSGCTGVFKKKRITVLTVPMGVPFTQDCVLALNNSGVGELIFFGACGALSDLKIGDWIVPEEVIFKNTAGEALHSDIKHTPSRFSSDSSFQKALRDFLFEKLSANSYVGSGIIATVNSFVCQEQSLLQRYRQEDIAGIELELFGFFNSVCALQRVSSGAVLWVSDCPLHRPLGSMEQKKKYNERLAVLTDGFIAVLDFLSR